MGGIEPLAESMHEVDDGADRRNTDFIRPIPEGLARNILRNHEPSAVTLATAALDRGQHRMLQPPCDLRFLEHALRRDRRMPVPQADRDEPAVAAAAALQDLAGTSRYRLEQGIFALHDRSVLDGASLHVSHGPGSPTRVRFCPVFSHEIQQRMPR
jgi:hypothetical protein